MKQSLIYFLRSVSGLAHRKHPLLVLGLVAGLITTTVLAHDTWLLPRQMAVRPGSVVRLDFTSGMAFPTLEYAIKAVRIEQANCRLAGHTFALEPQRAAPKSLPFRVSLKEAGVATLWVVLKPRTLDLKPQLVPEYLEEIGASQALRQSWQQAPTKRWREVYRKHAKTFVLVEPPGTDRSWAEPVGMALEIVPEKDPTTLHPGDEFPVRLLKQGAPLTNFPIGLVREGDKHGSLQTTDMQGRVTFKLPQPGLWLLRSTELRKSSRPEQDWESDFTTLTFVVR